MTEHSISHEYGLLKELWGFEHWCEVSFLNGDLDSKIYLKTPKGLDEATHQDMKNICLRLNKLFYDLVQAAP
jgi:hypothetical protein